MRRWHEEDGQGKRTQTKKKEGETESARRREVVRWATPSAAVPKSWPTACQPPERPKRCPPPAHSPTDGTPPTLRLSCPSSVVGSSLGLSTQIFLFPLTKFVIGFKKKKKKERERERDEVSQGPEPFLVLGTSNLGKKLREGRGMGRGGKKKRNNEKPNVRLKAEGEGIRGWPAAPLEA